MSIHCELVVLLLTMTIHGQVHTGKIIGGHEAMPHSRPYMVILELHMNDGKIERCGGFLLNEDFVMTAAHCQANSYKVLLGVHNTRVKTDIQTISVANSFPHQNYTGYMNDIMLLKLSSKANFSKNVRPIDIADKDSHSLPTSCSVSGWGRNDRLSVKLMEANVTLIDNKLCAMEKFYCSEGDTGPAEGDSGGPLVCEDGKAYGVVSRSFKPNSGGPTIYLYAKIPDDSGWIHSVMNTASSLSSSFLNTCKNYV